MPQHSLSIAMPMQVAERFWQLRLMHTAMQQWREHAATSRQLRLQHEEEHKRALLAAD